MVDKTDPFDIFAAKVAASIRGGKPDAAPDAFDPEKLPFGVAPGDNNLGLTVCPFCGKPATETGENRLPKAFLFRDALSAREYKISGLCQTCQDETFKEPEEEEDG